MRQLIVRPPSAWSRGRLASATTRRLQAWAIDQCGAPTKSCTRCSLLVERGYRVYFLHFLFPFTRIVPVVFVPRGVLARCTRSSSTAPLLSAASGIARVMYNLLRETGCLLTLEPDRPPAPCWWFCSPPAAAVRRGGPVAAGGPRRTGLPPLCLRVRRSGGLVTPVTWVSPGRVGAPSHREGRRPTVSQSSAAATLSKWWSARRYRARASPIPGVSGHCFWGTCAA